MDNLTLKQQANTAWDKYQAALKPISKELDTLFRKGKITWLEELNKVENHPVLIPLRKEAHRLRAEYIRN